MWRKIIILIVCVCCLCEAVPTVQAETKNIQVAFIRNHNLWIKIDGNEKQITKGEYITKPKWSHDGKWIAYAKGEEQNQLELYCVADRKKLFRLRQKQRIINGHRQRI